MHAKHQNVVSLKPAALSGLPLLLLLPVLVKLLLMVHLQLAGCASLCFGGPLHKDLVVSTTDGSTLLLSRNSNAGGSSNPSDVQVRCYLQTSCGPYVELAKLSMFAKQQQHMCYAVHPGASSIPFCYFWNVGVYAD
jgi:hypothetical protein